MKISVLTVLFVLSASVSAATLKNGVKLSNLPTASKSYSKSLDSAAEVPAARMLLEAECKKDMAEALNFIARNKGIILASEGCKVSEKIGSGNCDQGGCDLGAAVTTNFEVLFK